MEWKGMRGYDTSVNWFDLLNISAEQAAAIIHNSIFRHKDTTPMLKRSAFTLDNGECELKSPSSNPSIRRFHLLVAHGSSLLEVIHLHEVNLPT